MARGILGERERERERTSTVCKKSIYDFSPYSSVPNPRGEKGSKTALKHKH